MGNTAGADAVLTLATGVDPGLFSSADYTKLLGIQSKATSNATNAQLRDRSTHTGTQLLATISDAGTAASQDVGTAVGDVVQVADVGGNPGLPAGLDGSLLTNLPSSGYANDNYSIPGHILMPQASGPSIGMIITGVNGIRVPSRIFDGVAVETANFTDARPGPCRA